MKAEDHGVPSKSAFATVNIILTDINNRLPRFYNNPYVQYMSESMYYCSDISTSTLNSMLGVVVWSCGTLMVFDSMVLQLHTTSLSP